jgi:hypothetical protein
MFMLGGLGGLVTLIGMVAICRLSGCGASRPTLARHPVKVTAKSKAGAQKPVPSPAPRVIPPARTRALSTQTAYAAKTKENRRPKDVAEWKREDYQSAVRQHDPQLAAAVTYLGAHFAGSENVAEFLATLLEPPSAEAGAPGRSLAPAATQPQLIEAVVAALAANSTPRARQVLENLVDGASKTPHSSAAAVAALKALTAHPGHESDDLLFRVITAEDRTEDSPATNDLMKLSTTALGLIRTRKSESLAVRLATYMLAPETSRGLYDQLWGCLREPRAENLAAQIVLYQNDRSRQATRDWLEPRIAAYGSGALGCLLGVPAAQADPVLPGATRGSAAGPSMDSPAPNRREATLALTVATTNPYRLAERLWNFDLLAAIQRRLETAETLEKRSALVALAGTLPHATVRAALLRAMERHWDEGPKGLKMLRTAENVMVEPGFIALLKLLRRDDLAASPAGKDALGRIGNRYPSARVPARKTADLAGGQRLDSSGPEVKKYAGLFKAKIEQEKVGQQWMEFSQDVVQAVCRRLCAAARAKQDGPGDAGVASGLVDLPFTMHSRDAVVAVYRLDWPEDLREEIAVAPSSLHVRYVRIEEKAVPVKVLAYYRRQVPEARQRALTGGGWIDSVAIDKTGSSIRSVDVLVAKATNSALGLPNQEQELTVDILTVECEGTAKPNRMVASP